MFADLSLRGSKRSVFRATFGIDYEPEYIAIDRGGAMSWNFSPSDPFVAALSGSSPASPHAVAERFIETMGRTSRFLTRTAQIVAAPSRRRSSQLRSDLLEDLTAFWDAYEAHMSSLFTFWNVETLMTETLIDSLRAEGDQAEIDAGLPTFIRPSEPNWFALEQANLLTLQQRFGTEGISGADAASADHAAEFGFLLAPFNIGDPPSPADIRERMIALKTAAPVNDDYQPIIKHSPRVARIGSLERQLSYWKTERLDTFALADAYALPLYQTAGQALGAPLVSVFGLTREELTNALLGQPISFDLLDERAGGYCLALIDGTIRFYAPSSHEQEELDVAASGTVLRGTITSQGVVVGRVRIVQPGETPTLNDDEILVTQMTRPDMGAALDQALAYVTDEGGRLSHAAIVSREKKKPCVTALGNATRILRPGMLIEVNGDEGTVTVLDASFLSKHP
jgi:phosphohistidine swiveling domain-containing protein